MTTTQMVLMILPLTGMVPFQPGVNGQTIREPLDTRSASPRALVPQQLIVKPQLLQKNKASCQNVSLSFLKRTYLN